MSITEIRDIKKLQSRLKSALDEIEYLKECCTKTGEELAKYTFPYDYKEKNLVIQAKKINEEFERRDKALDDIENYVKNRKCKFCSTYKDNYCPEWFGEECDYKDLLNIISKVKESE